MSRLLLLAAAVFAVAGCSDLGYAQDVYNRIPGQSGRPSNGGYGRADDYSRTTEYRRISSDASDYARRLDSALRLSNGQEQRIENLLVDRTARLLQRTNPRDHRDVYPFPRRFSGDSRAARSFWASTDRDIERLLDRRDADAYRQYVRGGGRYDTRYNDGRYGNGTYGNGRSDDRGRDDRRDDRRDDDRRGRDDGERRGSDRDSRTDRDSRSNSGGRTDRGTQAAPDRSGPRPGETLEEWYRRQARRSN